MCVSDGMNDAATARLFGLTLGAFLFSMLALNAFAG
jgi:hypothetical protein